MNHVALIWTTAGHTYGVGVGGPQSNAVTLRLAETLARQLVLTPSVRSKTVIWASVLLV